MLLTGVPQSSILGPLFFQLSYKHIKEDISKHKIQRNTVEVDVYSDVSRKNTSPCSFHSSFSLKCFTLYLGIALLTYLCHIYLSIMDR